MPRISVPPLRKAYLMNQSQKYLGVFAEIGAGQEVSRVFFSAGMASNTIAKSMCAYAKEISDDIYLEELDEKYIPDGLGNGIPYTVRFRLLAMLDHEYQQLFKRMTKGKRIEDTAKSRGGQFPQLFVYANTITTGDTNPGDQPEKFHGWMGVRIHCAKTTEDDLEATKGSYIDFLAHVVLLEQDRRSQYTTIGMMGVNMIHTACTLLAEAPFSDDADNLKGLEAEVVDALFDEIGLWKIRVDVLEVNPSKELEKTGWVPNNRRLSMLLVHNLLSHDTLMTRHRFEVSAELGGVKDYEIARMGLKDAAENYEKRSRAIKKWLTTCHDAKIEQWAYPVDDLQVPSRYLFGRALCVGVGEFKGSEKDLKIEVPADVQKVMRDSAASRFPLVLLPYTDFADKKAYRAIQKNDFFRFDPIDNAYSNWTEHFKSSGVLLTRSTDMGWAIDMLNKSILRRSDSSWPEYPFQLVLSLGQWSELVDSEMYPKRAEDVRERMKAAETRSKQSGLSPEERRPIREEIREGKRELSQLSKGVIDCLQRIERSDFTVAVCSTVDELNVAVKKQGDSVVNYVNYLVMDKKVLALAT